MRLTHTLGLIAHYLDTRGFADAWKACGGWPLLHAGIEPETPTRIQRLTFHHPAPINADIAALTPLLGRAERLLKAEGYLLDLGGKGGLTSVRGTLPIDSAHAFLHHAARFDAHVAVPPALVVS